MNIHEYQGKSLINAYGAGIQEGFVAESPEQAVMVAKRLKEKYGSDSFVVKAQVHAGGRGKGGGVRLAKSPEEAGLTASVMLGKKLVTPQTGPEGKTVKKILVARDVYYNGESDIREFYVSILLDRNRGRYIIMYIPEGGMSVEELAENNPGMIFTEEIHPAVGLRPWQCRNIAFRMGLAGKANENMQLFLQSVYEAFITNDVQLLEINPVLKTSDDRILAVDCKVVLDDNALFRHPDLAAMRDIHEEDPLEVEAGRQGLSFIRLGGNVGCMVNGAGLAMATMDIIKLSGGEPANFLDVGGGAGQKSIEAGFRIILNDPDVKAMLINIFGGIVRCDRVAAGIVEACKTAGRIDIPVVVRLQGTNAEEAGEIIKKSGLSVYSAITFREAAEKLKSLYPSHSA